MNEFEYASLGEVLNHLKYGIKTKLDVSSINGVGVFAIVDISKGDEVFPVWSWKSGVYLIPNEFLDEIPLEVLELLNMYFINQECGYKLIRLFYGMNFLFNPYSYCNSAFNTKFTQNISNDGIALCDIKKGDEILEWYTENVK